MNKEHCMFILLSDIPNCCGICKLSATIILIPGQSCLDPRAPKGGFKIANSYADNSEVRFGCYRDDYELSSEATLICDGTQFVGTVPDCIGWSNSLLLITDSCINIFSS